MSAAGHSSRNSVLRIELGADFTDIRSAAGQLQTFLRENGCNEQARMDCELVLVEACNNAIKHTDAQAEHQPVLVEVAVDPQEIELRVTDHGPGFAWPETAELPDADKESGRGLFLIRALTDYSAYVRHSSENVLVLRKKRSAV